MSFEFFNWLGSLLLLVCSVPQAIKSMRDGHSDGLSHLMLWMWLLGMASCLVFFVAKGMMPNILNYAFNLFVAGVIIWYKYFPRKRTSPQ